MVELTAQRGGGKVLIEPDAIAAIEEGEHGSRITIAGAQIVVAESLAELVVAIQTRSVLKPDRVMNEVETKAVIGQKSICAACKEEIEYDGRVWRHTKSSPRHPAIPIKPVM
jgi:hypothetical protein